MEVFSLRYMGTRLFFGSGTVSKLKRYVGRCSLVGLVTGRRSARVCGALDDVLGVLREVGVDYVLYDRVEPNPWDYIADELAEKARGDGVDCFIAIGGGSVIDTAKLVSVLVYGRCARDYLYFKARPESMKPLYVVNTTHGTGSEIDRYAVLTVSDTCEKRGIAIRYPDVSIDDPRYTLTLPRSQTMYTVFDTLLHSYESATSTHSNPYNRLLARESTRLVNEYLGRALENPSDLEARYWLLYSSMIAGVSIDIAGTHLVHAIEHVLSGLEPKLAHGAGLAIITPKTIEYIHKAVPEKSAYILKAIDPSIKPVREDSERARRVIEEFLERQGFSERLSDYGFTVKDIAVIKDMLFNKLSYLLDGTPFTATEDIVEDIIRYSI